MRLKYYLRGLGFGVLVTAILLLLIRPEKEISDDEVIARATELGYVKNTDKQYFDSLKNQITGTIGTPVPSDAILTPDPEHSKTPTPAVQLTDTPLPVQTQTPLPMITASPILTNTPIPIVTLTPEPIITKAVIPTQIPVNTPTVVPIPTPVNTPTMIPTPVVIQTPEPLVTEAVIEVKKGMSSLVVSKLIYEAGIVTDAYDFNSYMKDNGYSTQIFIGKFTLNSQMTYEEIAKLLTHTK